MLGISETGLKILFLLIPGITALGVIKSVGPKRSRSDLENVLQIFMHGIISCALAGAIEGVYGWISHHAGRSFWEAIQDGSVGLVALNPQLPLSISSILIATVAAIGLAFLVALTQTYGYLHKWLFRLGLTTRQSEVDIWGYALNSRTIDNWVVVRHANGKVYQGWISGYSEGGDERELLLTEVTVYEKNPDGGNELSEVDKLPVLYLGIDRKEVTLEFQHLSAN